MWNYSYCPVYAFLYGLSGLTTFSVAFYSLKEVEPRKMHPQLNLDETKLGINAYFKRKEVIFSTYGLAMFGLGLLRFFFVCFTLLFSAYTPFARLLAWVDLLAVHSIVGQVLSWGIVKGLTSQAYTKCPYFLMHLKALVVSGSF